MHFIECLTIPAGILNFGRVSGTRTRPTFQVPVTHLLSTHKTLTLSFAATSYGIIDSAKLAYTGLYRCGDVSKAI